ncbi:DNA cytosine methyltransferase [Clostridium perfringens]|uniref:DNA cytosine methyltransferase n=1 Tax=Clostridium perfringens TaxID=1502 RepID=UPI001A199A51|nr:DNA cytosine methyltransferase [Clostridium perfringens]MDM0876304.1 DNA cytosine methyltransferase [Clostridium perfringens]HAT4157191.1 DNA cytosine methyltransferase [Clostridium perfringens]
MTKKLNTIELFAGCGGFVDGFAKSGKYNTLACVEWNRQACEVLKKRLKNKYNISEVDKKVIRFDIQRTDELLNGWNNDKDYGNGEGLKKLIGNNDVDLIVGGPPCQAYSIAGRIQDENGMHDDYRNYLFESYIKVVEEFTPKIIVFENVEGILSAKPGGESIIDRIMKAFDEVGYTITNNIRKNALLDLSMFGIPQKRKRVILIGLRKEYFGENCENLLDDLYKNKLPRYQVEKIKSVKDAIADLPKLVPNDKDIKIGRKKYSHSPESTDYLDHYPRYHNKRDIEIFRELALDIENGINKYSSTDALKKMYTEKTGKKSNIHKYNVLKWDEPSNTIPAHLKKDGLRHIHPDYLQARSITVREAARLQSFDDDFEFSGMMTADYEMIGNAVPPEFARRLAECIYEFYKKSMTY